MAHRKVKQTVRLVCKTGLLATPIPALGPWSGSKERHWISGISR